MYVVGYPRSGNTWLCYLLAYCLNAEYDDMDAPDVHPRNDYQRRYVKGSLSHQSFSSQAGRILKTHALQVRWDGTPIVYIVRDGRDVMVSYYHYRYRMGKDERSDEPNLPSFSEFLKRYVPEWMNHVSTWIGQEPRILVRYEDLLVIPEEILPSLFHRLGINVRGHVVGEAIETFSFRKLSRRNPGEEDPGSFFRKGVVGDWVKHFSDDDLHYFKETAGALMCDLNYVSADLHWARKTVSTS
jgi:hypothetical protein